MAGRQKKTGRRLIDKALNLVLNDGLEATPEIADELSITVKHARILLASLWVQGYLKREPYPTFFYAGSTKPCHRYFPGSLVPGLRPRSATHGVRIPAHMLAAKDRAVVGNGARL